MLSNGEKLSAITTLIKFCKYGQEKHLDFNYIFNQFLLATIIFVTSDVFVKFLNVPFPQAVLNDIWLTIASADIAFDFSDKFEEIIPGNLFT